jgi:hypothetical protein
MTWDGDDLAGQAEDEEERKQALAETRQNKPRLTPEERARSVELESLRLSRSRIVSQLANATNPAHRRMLETALQSIDEKMRQ